MRLFKWIQSLYEPKKTNFKDAVLEDLESALNHEGVRKHWLNALVEELRAINIGVDRALADNMLDEIQAKAIRRRTIVFCLNQILESQTAVETELYEQQQHNNPTEPHWGGRTVQDELKGRITFDEARNGDSHG